MGDVGYKKPPKHGQIKKGEIRNPKGGGAHDPQVRRIKQLTTRELAEVCSLIVKSTRAEIKKMADSPNSTLLQGMCAALAKRTIERGDPIAFDKLLDRLVGKVKNTVEVSGPDGGPIRSQNLSAEEREAEIKRLDKLAREIGND